MTLSNYDKAKHDAALLFCQTDHTEIIERFNLSKQDGFLPLHFFGQPFRLSLTTGAVERMREGAWIEAGFNEAMTLYDLLGYAQPRCHASGRMVNTKSLYAHITAAAPSPGNFYRRQEELFDKQSDKMMHVLESLGGKALPQADAAAQFAVFDDLTMQVHFWCSDEDFPPSLELFWDENVLQYMHYETVWYANGFIVSEIEAHCTRSDSHL